MFFINTMLNNMLMNILEQKNLISQLQKNKCAGLSRARCHMLEMVCMCAAAAAVCDVTAATNSIIASMWVVAASTWTIKAAP